MVLVADDFFADPGVNQVHPYGPVVFTRSTIISLSGA